MMSWRQNPSGQAYDALVVNRRAINPVGFRRDILQLTEEELIELFETEHASPHMIEIELAKWRPLKAAHDKRMAELERKRAHHDDSRLESVDESVLPYVRAGRRRRDGTD